MKHLLAIFIFIFSQTNSFSQTIIAPSLGYDFTMLESVSTNPHFPLFKIRNEGYEIKSPVVGLKLEQYLFNWLSLSYRFNYTRKKADAFVYGIASYNGFRYDYYVNRIGVNIMITRPLYVGLAGNYNLFKSWRYTIDDEVYGEFVDTFKDVGGSIVLGVNVKNVNLEAYYYIGSNSNSVRYLDVNLRPTRSFGLLLGYDIQLFDKFRGKRNKRADCPTF
jgi:hypothetical protein